VDPQFVFMAAAGALSLIGRLHRRDHGPSVAGDAVRAVARASARPAAGVARHVPVVGGLTAAVVTLMGTVVAETAGEVLDGAAATGMWLTRSEARSEVPAASPAPAE